MSERSVVEFDETDLTLLKRIESDFDVSLETLADELELSKSAIHYRLNNLREDGIITGRTADLDPAPFGLEMVAITEITVTHHHGYSESIGEELANIPGVEQVYYTMGDVDFITISRVQDRDQMNTVIESMVAVDDVNETSSHFVMSEVKSTPQVLTNLPSAAYENIRDTD